MLKLSTAIGLLFISSYAQAGDYLLAQSKSTGIDVLIENATESNWCKPSLSIKMTASSVESAKAAELMGKLGSLINNQCSSAKEAKVQLIESGVLTHQGNSQAPNWSLSFAKVEQTGGAKEDKKPEPAQDKTEAAKEIQKPVEEKPAGDADVQKLFSSKDGRWYKGFAYLASQNAINDGYDFNKGFLDALVAYHLQSVKSRRMATDEDYQAYLTQVQPLAQSAKEAVKDQLIEVQLNASLTYARNGFEGAHKLQFGWHAYDKNTQFRLSKQGINGYNPEVNEAQYKEVYVTPENHEALMRIMLDKEFNHLNSNLMATLTFKPKSAEKAQIKAELISMTLSDRSGKVVYTHDAKAMQASIDQLRKEEAHKAEQEYQAKVRAWEENRLRYIEISKAGLANRLKNPVLVHLAEIDSDRDYAPVYRIRSEALSKNEAKKAITMVNVESDRIVWPIQSKVKGDVANGWQMVELTYQPSGDIELANAAICKQSMCREYLDKDRINSVVSKILDDEYLAKYKKPVKEETK